MWDDSLTAFPRPIMALFHFLHSLPGSLGSNCGVHIPWDKASAVLGSATWPRPLAIASLLAYPKLDVVSQRVVDHSSDPTTTCKVTKVTLGSPNPIPYLLSYVPCCASDSPAGRESVPR